ncbi:MAG TPA: PTS ascorbate transporter subunit IIC [Mycobacteriales bacterium]|nr:PTS ascorbate transporter subunit IIC [Mycobacteriales bacterium]
MHTFEKTLEWFANNIFNEVAILIAIIVLIGLALQKKRGDEIMSGAIRAAVGVYAMFIGIAVFVGGLSAFQAITASAFGKTPPSSLPKYSLDKFMADKGAVIAMVITVAFLMHIAIVRLFRLKFVYLTGHLMFWMSVVVTASLSAGWAGMGKWTMILVGAAIVATYWTVQPIVLQKKMERVIGSDDWGYGHTSASAAYLGAAIGKRIGDPERQDTEKLHMPRWLSFFKDVNVATAVVIMAIMLIAMAFADPKVYDAQAATYSATMNPWVWAVVSALRFAGGIAVLLFGVRMFLAEIVPAFKGISDKVIPGARPALDCPTVFPYSPTAVMIGFLSSTAVFLVMMALFPALGWFGGFVLVPPMIMLFFPGGAAGVFGNKHGGWPGAVAGGAVNGLFLAFGQAITWNLLVHNGPQMATLADPDWYIVNWAILFVRHPLGFADGYQGFVTVFGWIFTAVVIYGLYSLYKRLTGPKAIVLPSAPADARELTKV